MSRPVIDIDEGSGFCHGVVRAIAKAEDELRRSPTLYCLGDIVHNNVEVERLSGEGLRTITHDDLATLHGAKVLLRAHGEPPSTYRLAEANAIEIVDATCPVVLKLQQRIRRGYETLPPTTQIAIYGKKGHAEVNGLVGQTDGTAIVIENVASLSQLDFDRDIELYSQTTMPLEGFRAIVDEIEQRRNPATAFHYYDTICRQVANRVERLRRFAAERDVVLFVSGLKSSNGKVLYEHCRQVNPRTHMVASADDVDSSWLKGYASIGICGATSTPRWLMERVRDHINHLLDL